ncbi:MAG: hypothetical protein KKB20_18450, partial [Proteobacteria bacterium]|nr:hypothetical protein [Pseudomonadota bacterium]
VREVDAEPPGGAAASFILDCPLDFNFHGRPDTCPEGMAANHRQRAWEGPTRSGFSLFGPWDECETV